MKSIQLFISLFLLLFLIIGMTVISNAQTIGIMTSPPGTTTYSMGVAIAKVIQEKTDLKARVQPQAASPFLAVDSGTADFGMSNCFDLTFAVMGVDEYKDLGPRKNLCLAATMMPYRVALHVRKDSDIRSIKDLKGKRVGSGFHAQKTIGRIITAFLANAGLTYDDVKQVPAPNVARSAEDFSAGKSDVLFFALGAAIVMEVSKKVGGLRVLPIDSSPEAMARIEKFLPGAYVKEVSPGPNLEGITEPTKVLHFDNVLYTNKNISEEIIYKVVKAIYENKKDLVSSFGEFSIFIPEHMGKPVKNVDFHPGALKFYKEIGLVPPKK
jgi:TRAP transporter TAXI family solute receptor